MLNKYLVITCIYVFLLIALLMFCMKINVDESIQLSYIEECIIGRSCKEINGEYFIGNNDKEITNGFYDLKISNIKNGISFKLNKLWYKQFNKNMYEQEYVRDISQYIYNTIMKSTQIILLPEELEVIYHDLLEGYVEAKNGNEFYAEYIIKSIKFQFYSKNYELNLIMEVI